MGKFRHSPTFNKFLQTRRSEEISYHTSTNSVSSPRKVYTELAINLKGVYKIQYRKICRRRLWRGFAPGERRLQGSRETEPSRAPTVRALPILYKRLYTDLYIYPHSYIFNFFPISHRLFSVCETRAARVCAAAIRTERTFHSSIYVFLERVKLLYLSFLLFAP